MENKEIEEFLVAYRKGATTDFIQPKLNGKWGALWTFPPCDPAAAQRVGQLMVRMGATEIRWIRRARLNISTGRTNEALIVLTMPNEQQDVMSLSNGIDLGINSRLVDESYIALKMAFTSKLNGLL